MGKYMVILSVILVIIFAGCESVPSSPEYSTDDSMENTTVLISDFSYVPSNITVKQGTTVKWVQKDSVRHTVTSDDGIFDSGLLSKDVSFEYTFNEVGTFGYYCIPHPYMKGSVEVVR